MKRSVLLFIFLFAVSSAKAQFETNYYLGVGLSGAITGGIGGLDFVVDRYNETRTWLDDDMDHVNSLTGFNFIAGIHLGGLLMDFTYSSRSSTSSASGIQPNNNLRGERDLKFVMSSIQFGFGFLMYNDFPLMHGPGISIDLPSVTVSTKTDTDDEYRELVDGDGNLAFSFYWQVFYAPFENSSFILSARPYYQLFLTDYDYYPVNKNINSATYIGDNYDDVYGKANNLGLDIQILYVSDLY